MSCSSSFCCGGPVTPSLGFAWSVVYPTWLSNTKVKWKKTPNVAKFPCKPAGRLARVLQSPDNPETAVAAAPCCSGCWRTCPGPCSEILWLLLSLLLPCFGAVAVGRWPRGFGRRGWRCSRSCPLSPPGSTKVPSTAVCEHRQRRGNILYLSCVSELRTGKEHVW